MSDQTATRKIDEIVEAAVKQLVSSHIHADAQYVNLPLLYPDGSHVTLKIVRAEGGYTISDNGFAYREAEAAGYERSFGKTASSIVEKRSVEANKRAIFTKASADDLFRAICDVGIASWETVDRIYGRIDEQQEIEIAEHLRDRLKEVFGPSHVEEAQKIAGASKWEWDVSAIVRIDTHRAIFQGVGQHATSVYKASTAFRDIALLPKPPRLIAVVQSKKELGSKLDLLVQAEASVIEEEQADEVFVKAAA